MSALISAGPFCAGQTPPIQLATLAQSAPTFDFCSSGQVIQYLNPINMQKQLFTVPYTPSLPTWEELVGHYIPVVAHSVTPPVVSPVVDPPVVIPPLEHEHHDGDGCGHHNPPPAPTPEPSTYGLMFAGGSFLIVLGARKRKGEK